MENINISTSSFVHTISQLVPLDNEIYPLTLGIQTSPHLDIKDAIELVYFQQGTSAHFHIKSWKQGLKGTIITNIDGKLIKKYQDIADAIAQAQQECKQQVKIKFGLLAGFVMSGKGIPTLQADQLNIIAHHIHTIETNNDLWPKKYYWPQNINTTDMIDQDIYILKLQQQRLQQQSDQQGFYNQNGNNSTNITKLECLENQSNK